MTFSRTGRLLAAGVTGLALSFGYAAASAPPGAAASRPSGPDTSVTVFLKAPNAAALEALAAQPITDRAQRLAELARLVPSSDQHNQVAAVLRSEGFHVGRQSAWSISASAPASVVSSVFGTRPTLTAHATPADRRAATGPLSALPQTLTGLVSEVYPAGGPSVFHSAADPVPLKGSDFRNADTPAGVAPSTGSKDGPDTVATLQLASFNSADLTHYAATNGLPDPVASKQYQAVTVDGGPGAGQPTPEGDIEVALDQESILSTAPSAHQQAYFAPNSNQGFADVFSHVYDDVTGNSMATAPNAHITALSSSWGLCESATGATTINNLYEPVIASVVAAGVNVFASSGDDGIYDCRSTTGTGVDNKQEDVDFPTSSPLVVSVGGTYLQPNPVGSVSTANNGGNWDEHSWTCTTAMECQATNVPTVGTGGTGGGVSGSAFGSVVVGSVPPTKADFAGFPKPAYQASAVTNAPFAGVTKRMVPDIAADADPNTGFIVYSSDPAARGLGDGSGNLQVGGTSLAAPISAAQFTNTLGDANLTYGTGDIHPALYQAYASTQGLAATDPRRVFRDVTTGSNGDQADAHADPSVQAAAGYDTNTGLGGVLWSALTPYLPATVTHGGKIKVRAHLKIRMAGHGAHRHRVVLAKWRTKAPTGTPVTTKVRLKLRPGHHKFKSDKLHGHKRIRARAGRVYVLTVVSTDAFGDKTKKHARLRVKPLHR